MTTHTTQPTGEHPNQFALLRQRRFAPFFSDLPYRITYSASS